MTIQNLFTEFQKLVKEDKLYLCERYNNADLFLDFRKTYGLHLKKEDEQFLITLLQDKQWLWFVPNVLRVLEWFPKRLFYELIKKAINTKDPSSNNNFIDPCLRVYNVFLIDDILIEHIKNGTTEEKLGAINAFHWTRPHIKTYCSGENFEHEETFGYKPKWSDQFNMYDWPSDLNKMDEKEFKEYHKKSKAMMQRRYKILLQEFLDNEDPDIRYRITLSLPSKVKDFPTPLEKSAKQYFKLKKRKGISSK